MSTYRGKALEARHQWGARCGNSVRWETGSSEPSHVCANASRIDVVGGRRTSHGQLCTVAPVFGLVISNRTHSSGRVVNLAQ